MLRDNFRTFSESAKPILHLMKDIDLEAPAALRSGVIRAKHEAVRSASLVLLSGLLESFLRMCAEAFFEELVRRNLQYGSLPEVMKQHHFLGGIEQVRSVAREEKKESSHKFEKTMSSIARIVDAPNMSKAALYWEAFASTNGNPGPEVIADYLRKFAVEDPLRNVAAAVRTTEPLLRVKLTSFISLRNECAHTGRAKTTPLPSEVKDFVHFLRLLALAITKVLDKQITDLCRP